MSFKIQGFFKDIPKFKIKFKDFSRISRIGIKFKDFKDFFKDVATLYNVACQAHPAFIVKQVQSRSIFLNFKWSVIKLTLSVNGLKGPWFVSCRCPEPRWFNGDPTSLACDNIQTYGPLQYIVGSGCCRDLYRCTRCEQITPHQSPHGLQTNNNSDN